MYFIYISSRLGLKYKNSVTQHTLLLNIYKVYTEYGYFKQKEKCVTLALPQNSPMN